MSDETENTVVEAKPKREMIRVNDEDRLFYTGKPVRENTTFGFLSSHLVDNPGITAAGLIEYMENNFQPQKSEKFGRSFCRAYVRGMVKEGYAHRDEDEGPGASELVEPAPVVREKKEKEVSPQSNQIVELLTENGTMTVQELCEATGKNARSINAMLRSLITKGLVESEEILGEDGKVEGKNISLAA